MTEAALHTTPRVTAAAAGSHWRPAAAAAAAFAGVAALNLGWVPGLVVSHWVPLVLLASGCMAAVRWKRAGVRRELRGRAAARLARYGGGVYGAMAMATLLWLEGSGLASGLAAAGSLGAFVRSLDLGWLVSQAVGSVGSALRAGMWPWHWFGGYGVVAAMAAAGADALLAFVLPRYRAYRSGAPA